MMEPGIESRCFRTAELTFHGEFAQRVYIETNYFYYK